jgi:hypothetical protein
LNQESRDDDVSRGHTINLSSLQLLEEACHNLYVMSRRTSGRQKICVQKWGPCSSYY